MPAQRTPLPRRKITSRVRALPPRSNNLIECLITPHDGYNHSKVCNPQYSYTRLTMHNATDLTWGGQPASTHGLGSSQGGVSASALRQTHLGDRTLGRAWRGHGACVARANSNSSCTDNVPCSFETPEKAMQCSSTALSNECFTTPFEAFCTSE
eukprot:gene11023-biopygen12371